MTAGGNNNLEELVERCGQVYSLPAVAVRVLALAQSPGVDVRAIKECIENDPAITSKILRVVNSSLFGLAREVSDLTQALALLGINPLKLLVLGFSLPSALFINVNRDMLRRYWRRTLVKAIAAREISQTVLGKLGDEAFLAGLLHDIGELVLLQELGESYSRLLTRTCEEGGKITVAESEELGFDHVTLSARLLERWRLPRQVVLAVEAANSRERIERLDASAKSLAEVLFAADLVAAVLVENRTDVLPELLIDSQNGLSLTHAQLASIVATLSARVDQLAQALELDLPASRDYQEVLIEAHAQLSIVASEAAEQLLSRQVLSRANSPNHPAAHEQPDEHGEIQLATPAGVRSSAATVHTDTDSGLKELSTSVLAPAFAARPYRLEAEAPRSRIATSTESAPLDPGFFGRLMAAVATCRQARTSVSVMIAEMDQYEELLLVRGRRAAEQLIAQLGQWCREVDHPGGTVVQSRDVQFAVILPACDRRQAVSLSNELIDRARRASLRQTADDAVVVTVSVGVATVALPPKNFPAIDLINAADRCLNGARLSGGNTVKSIEIY
jgi:HD-like signal output (HDOD) protein/GGDEF domain-containing protein